MAELKDVDRWFIERGIGHIVQSCSNKGLFLLCPAWIVGVWDYRTLPQKQPKRICKKCRKNLKLAEKIWTKKNK